MANWEAVVDAHANELIVFEGKSNCADVQTINRGQYPVSNDGVPPDGIEIVFPMPFAHIFNIISDIFL